MYQSSSNFMPILDDNAATCVSDVKLFYRNNFAIFQLDCPKSNHGGKWKVVAINSIDSGQ